MEGLRVFEKQSLLVKEDRTSLFKRNAMLPLVGACLSRVPLKPDLAHGSMYTSGMYTRNRLEILSAYIPEPVGTFQLTLQKLPNRPQPSSSQAQLQIRLKSSSPVPFAKRPVGSKAAHAAEAGIRNVIR